EDASERAIQVITPIGSPRPFREFLRAEEEAATERTLQLQVVPGLLQTADYTRALNERGQQFFNSNARPGRYVTARQSRQARLTEGYPYPMRFHAVLDESVIHRVVGGPQVMAEQLQHLLTLGKQTNVTIQVVPFETGSYGTMSSGFIIVGYGEEDDDPPVV